MSPTKLMVSHDHNRIAHNQSLRLGNPKASAHVAVDRPYWYTVKLLYNNRDEQNLHLCYVSHC